ncbi:MAG: hypothetical protein RIR70_1614 [Pseudomonadota bacterium]
MINSRIDPKSQGFSLIELVIVLAVVGVLMGGLIMPLSAQIDARNLTDTQKTLSEAKEALIGYAAANGRLPCPATATSNGLESPDGGGVCTNAYSGFLPAATLGLTVTDNQGFALDAWGNRLRYAVTPWKTSLYTTVNALKNNWPLSDSRVLLTLSSTAANGNIKLADNAIAVIFSVGKNKSNPAGLDESHNLNNDAIFISHEATSEASPGGEFDDVVTWLAEPIFFNRLISAGRLP